MTLGNTLFWTADQASMNVFSRIMSTPWMQRQILEKNFFVEQIVPRGMAHSLTPREMDHYRKAQPSPAARRGVAEMPRQILAAQPLLARLTPDVPATLGSKPALPVWGMKDSAFKPRPLLPRMQDAFPNNITIELPRAGHYIQEDAPEGMAEAITNRFR